MRVEVLLFGPQAAMAQADRIAINLDSATATAGQVLSALRQAAPTLAPSLDTSRLAVNHAYAYADDPITRDDEVALIGMVSGG